MVHFKGNFWIFFVTFLSGKYANILRIRVKKKKFCFKFISTLKKKIHKNNVTMVITHMAKNIF